MAAVQEVRPPEEPLVGAAGSGGDGSETAAAGAGDAAAETFGIRDGSVERLRSALDEAGALGPDDVEKIISPGRDHAVTGAQPQAYKLSEPQMYPDSGTATTVREPEVIALVDRVLGKARPENRAELFAAIQEAITSGIALSQIEAEGDEIRIKHITVDEARKIGQRVYMKEYRRRRGAGQEGEG